MSSIIKFIHNMFSSNSTTPKQELILTNDGCVVLNPSSEDVKKIEIERDLCDVTDIMNPLHPLNIKCGSSLEMSMMCLTY